MGNTFYRCGGRAFPRVRRISAVLVAPLPLKCGTVFATPHAKLLWHTWRPPPESRASECDESLVVRSLRTTRRRCMPRPVDGPRVLQCVRFHFSLQIRCLPGPRCCNFFSKFTKIQKATRVISCLPAPGHRRVDAKLGCEHFISQTQHCVVHVRGARQLHTR